MVQCLCTTSKGTQCQLKAQKGSSYCYLHKNCQKPWDLTKQLSQSQIQLTKKDKNGKEVVLELDFELGGIDCISFAVISRDRWEKIRQILKEKEIIIQAYASAGFTEISGEDFESAQLLKNIKIIDDEESVKAFKTFFKSDSFYVGDDMLGKLFQEVKQIETD